MARSVTQKILMRLIDRFWQTSGPRRMKNEGTSIELVDQVESWWGVVAE